MHTSSIEHVSAALALQRSVGRGAGGWRLASREAVAPQTDAFFFLVGGSYFRTQRHRIEPGGGTRAKGGAAKE